MVRSNVALVTDLSARTWSVSPRIPPSPADTKIKNKRSGLVLSHALYAFSLLPPFLGTTAHLAAGCTPETGSLCQRGEHPSKNIQFVKLSEAKRSFIMEVTRQTAGVEPLFFLKRQVLPSLRAKRHLKSFLGCQVGHTPLLLMAKNPSGPRR